MSEATETAEKICAVCGRRLLIGERSSQYVSREGAEVDVCELCKVRAESAGWMRPEDAAQSGAAGGGRRRRRRGGELLGGLLARAEKEREQRRERREQAAAEREAVEQEAVEQEAGGRSEAKEEPRRRARAPQAAGRDAEAEARRQRSAAGPDVNQAVDAFNASENRRTIAGLSRSLGDPRATVIAVRTAGGHTGARLTVAWDLAWYQWEIGPGKRGPEIRQIAKGETIDQLRAADRNWNLKMAGDGTLSRRRSEQ